MVKSFEGNTWVAFIDISGFKQMLTKDVKQAERALEKFYKKISTEVFTINNTINSSSSPYEIYSDKPSINSVVVSDAAVLFIDNQNLAENKTRDLHIMLDLIKSVNLSLIDPAKKTQIMTTCAIDYGHFKYDNKSYNIHITKSFFYGSAYVNAYLGNGTLSDRTGFCRVLTSDFTIPEMLKKSSPFNLLSQVNSVEKNFDFYWMLSDPEKIVTFRDTYDNVAQSLYTQIAKLLSTELKDGEV